MHVPTRVIRPQRERHVVWQAKSILPTRFGSFELHVFHELHEPVESGQAASGAAVSSGPVIGTGAAVKEHIAMVFGDVRGPAVPVRVHSECMTSEVFGSLKCDCKEQLDYALAEAARRGRGAVLYLRQEGRGIGLTNKIRAYALQAQGYDTVDANRMLGLPDDARTYDIAQEMLEHLGIESVSLMTNNPEKVKRLEALGVEVVERLPVIIEPNAYSRSYLETKRARMDHLLPDLRTRETPAAE